MPLNSGIVNLFIFKTAATTTTHSCFLSLVVKQRQDSPKKPTFSLVNALFAAGVAFLPL